MVFPPAATNRKLTSFICRVLVKPGTQTSNPDAVVRTEIRLTSIAGGAGSCCRFAAGKATVGGVPAAVCVAEAATVPVIPTGPETVPAFKV